MSEKKLSSLVTFNEAEYNNYQKSLASKKEWPGITVNITKDSRMTLNTPMLIMELYRLVPYKEGRYIHFHPFNMPYIKILEDGTGVIEIHYKMQQYMSMLEQRQQINEKYRNLAGNLKKNETKVVQNVPNKLPKSRPGFIYSRDTSLQDIAVLENKWWLETNNGFLGKRIEPFNYVYVIGYPCLDVRFQEIQEDITTEFIEHAKLTMFALSVTCISEETYNKKLSTWINTTICQRYKEIVL